LLILVKAWTVLHRQHIHHLGFFDNWVKTGIDRTPCELLEYWWENLILPGLILTSIALDAILLINLPIFLRRGARVVEVLFYLEIMAIVVVAPIIFSF
jgi:hypothetical protein